MGDVDRTTKWLLFSLTGILLTCSNASGSGPKVTHLEHHVGSLAGETRLTIHGSGFSANQFNFGAGNTHLGNTVTLVSSTQDYDCPVHKDGSHERQIMCYTPPNMKEDNYYVRVKVDGTSIEDANLCNGNPNSYHCQYTPHRSYTPTIDYVVPRSGIPGTIVDIRGLMFTDRYGGNLENSTNERYEKILRVFVGPLTCELKDPNLDILPADGDKRVAFYYLNLDDSGASNWGRIRCKTQGTSLGYYNASYIVEAPFGRAFSDLDNYMVSRTDKIYMYQTFTEIHGLSQSSGSTEGDLTLTVHGLHFDETPPYTPARVYIAGTECMILEVQDTYIKCRVAADPGTLASDFTGNRGLLFERWDNTAITNSNLDDILTLTSSDPGYSSAPIDESYFEDSHNDTFVTKTSGYFIPSHDGEYQFYLQADDRAKMFFSPISGVPALKEEVVDTGSNVWSSRFSLTAGTPYYMQIVHREGSGNAFFRAGAKFYDTQFTSDYTAKVDQEIQTIRITSTVVPEVQILDFQGFSQRSETHEVQTVDMTTSGSFRFGLYDVFTGPLTINDDDVTVAEELSSLPVFSSTEQISVTSTQHADGSGRQYEITFQTKRGAMPDIGVKEVAGENPVTATVSTNTVGQPDMETLTLALSGVLSPLFTVSDLTSATLEATLDTMFGAQCPKFILSPKNPAVFENYESGVGSSSGVRVKEQEAFCGRYTLKNPNLLYQKDDGSKGIVLATNKMLCFAYKGMIKDSLSLGYSYKDPTSGDTVSARYTFVQSYVRDSETESTTWHYNCTDMMDLVQGRHPTISSFRLESVAIKRQNDNVDVFIDTVYIGPATTIDIEEITIRRMRPAMPSGAIIDTVSVTETSGGAYEVTLTPFDCGNNLPLFSLANGEWLSGNSGSSSAINALKNGGNGQLSVQRKSAASPPVTGTIDVTFNGHTQLNIDVTLEADNLLKELQAIPGIGNLNVDKEDNCANFDITVTMLSLPGDQPQMTVAKNLNGINPDATVSTNVDGGLWYLPIQGDMLRTHHSLPQVTAFINDVPTRCADGSDCSFTWSSAATPTVTGVDISSGSNGDTIVITGTKFDASISGNNKVEIGGVSCAVTASKSTTVTCTVGDGPRGTYRINVEVDGQGLSKHSSGDITFTYSSEITSISPTSSGCGGTTITISGHGFNPDSVNVGSSECYIISSSTSEVVCRAPASVAGQFDVIISQGGSTLTHTGFTYTDSVTPKISAISPAALNVEGGTVTLTGNGFGVSEVSSDALTVGGVVAGITSYSDTEVVAEVPALVPGEMEVRLMTANGYAVVQSSGTVPALPADLSVTNVFPLQGSLYGGTRLTITGSGFSTNTSKIEVTVGGHVCDVESASVSQIICLIADTATTHVITNGGTHKELGSGYAWDPAHKTIKINDFVQWQWSIPEFVNDIGISVHQVDGPSATVPTVGGFTSGAKSKSGSYEYRFTEPGFYNIWSGHVDLHGLMEFRGSIEVVALSSSLGEIAVKVSGKSAIYTVAGAVDPTDSSSCQSTLSAIPGCTNALPTGGDAAKFNFAFWSCLSPIATEISVDQGTTNTGIVISGQGFSDTNCQNEIKFGNDVCLASTSSSNSLTCSVEPGNSPLIGTRQDLSLRVGNRGNAMVVPMKPLKRNFVLLPTITDYTPTSGSKTGGTRLTITGTGFSDDVTKVFSTVDMVSCDIISATYTQIICTTPSFPGSEKTVNVSVEVNGNIFPAKCEKASDPHCRFRYGNEWTPNVASISPASVSTSTTLTIAGQKLGSLTSGVEVSIGGTSCSVTSVNGVDLECSVANLPAGSNAVVVNVLQYGHAEGSITVTGTPEITSISPSSGSLHGGNLLSINGNGFVDGATSVTIDGTACNLQSVTLSQVVCEVSAHAGGTVSVAVTSNGQLYTSQSYTYAATSTPVVNSVSPTDGQQGDTLTINGQYFAATGTNINVTLDGVPCDVTSQSTTQIQCILGAHATGSTPVLVHVEGKGNSNTNVAFNYGLTISSINPTSGSTFGGQLLTVTGTGFDTIDTTVSISGKTCVVDTSAAQSSTQYICRSPSGTGTCDVAVSANGLSGSLSGAYTYDASLTPEITGVSPTRGGTGGGTALTVTGTGFGTNQGATSVRIDGSTCNVISVTNTQITCQTGSHAGTVTAPVEVEISGNGLAKQTSADFNYVDVWSSPFTWGGNSPPKAGEFVIIPEGQTILLDNNTEVLKVLLIQGGALIFDEKDIELNAEIILITNGGLLQVGTEEEPFPPQFHALITLHGHQRDKELPIYGTKVLALREGILDLHGSPVAFTWTRLGSTALAGTNQITLTHPVDWSVGDEVAIASTAHMNSQKENEQHKITAISSDRLTLTLEDNLTYNHTGITETYDGTPVEFRAEVGLLTRNVKVQGNQNPQWLEEIEACPEDFNTGEFATQSCFQGRFGEEIGSDGFGAQIIVHHPEKDSNKAIARISYVEVYFAGQEFRLGRYPLHFHLNGDMSLSYIRGCGVHHTFNRAINIHGSHNTLIEWNVVYNIKGGATFLEDGIEHGNTFQYNLAVFVRESSALLNDDITPASFWATNPNNTYLHNAAAGGTHFGFWYSLHAHPEGPSATDDVCPDKLPLGRFFNNTAHSFGWFGLWIFENYFPMKDGCTASEVQPALFEKFLAWNCDKGAEGVNGGAFQFDDFILVQNRLSGYEGKTIDSVPQFTDESPMVSNSLIVGHTFGLKDDRQGSTAGGIVFPYGSGFRVKNVRFVNFDEPSSAAFRWTRLTCICPVLCGGYSYHVEGLKFVNADNRAIYEWEWEGVIVDKDGSASGKTDAKWNGGKIIPTTGIIPSDCESIGTYSIGIPASICPGSIKFHRFAFNNIQPSSLEGKRVMITNRFGTSYGPFAPKRMTHKPGWMVTLVGKESHTLSFENGNQFMNVSYNGAFFDFQPGDYLFMKMNLAEFPDRFSIDGGKQFINASTTPIDPTTATTGDWYWDNTAKSAEYIVHSTKRSKRNPVMNFNSVDRQFAFTSFKCYYKDCIPPPDPDSIPPATARPPDYQLWSTADLWQVNNATGYVDNSAGGNGTYGAPQDGDSVQIVADEWMVADVDFPQLGTLVLYGVLELDNALDTSTGQYKQFTLRANYIIIYGGRLIIGWPNDPFLGLASIILSGTHSSEEFPRTSGPPIGAKVIGVFGGLDLFGKDVGVKWTQLSTTANAGDNQIVLRDNVTWNADDEIVIAPTGYNAWHTETFKLTAVSADGYTLTLNDTLKYTHISYFEELSNGKKIDMAAEVGLLTRNIKVIGKDYNDMWNDGFGARVLVSSTEIGSQTYTGYARLDNVEFYHTGQGGYTENYDARYSVTYMAVPVNNIKPSKLSNCAFHHGFSPAIGIYGATNMTVESNVIHHTVGNAFVTESDSTMFSGNLIVLLVWTGAYMDRAEPNNIRYEAGVEAMFSTGLKMENNVVAGSERAGYHVLGQDCATSSATYVNNVAHSCLIGVQFLPDDEIPFTCVRVMGFNAWKNHDYGIYYQNIPSLEFDGNTLSENGVGIYPMVLQPSAREHAYEDKSVTVRNGLFVGTTSSFDCASDITPSGDTNFRLSGKSRPSKTESGGRIGLNMPQFATKTNGATLKPFAGAMSEPALKGVMKVSDVTLAHFGTRCNGQNRDAAFATNYGNDDGQHPVELSSVNTNGVDPDSIFFIHRPNAGKINGADCVDMDCDAKKKALFKDMDGSILGSPGAVISQSEFEWDVNPVRGLGDYRIPNVMLTESDGSRIPVNDIAPNKGIIRNNNCTYRSTWQAWQCYGLDYYMLIIESLDEDSLTRSLSPVAILGDGYIDLINGPQDHGICSSYSCRERLSTFMALVAAGKHFDMYLTGTTPQNMRYFLLNSDSTRAVSLAMWYSVTSRLDVYYDDLYVPPTNLKPNSGNSYILQRPSGSEFQPHVDNSSGTNYLDKDTQMLYFIVKGPKPVKIVTKPVIMVSFSMPAVEVDDFYGPNMVQILAGFLNIPVEKIRIVDVVSAASASTGRRKRSTSGVVVKMEIGNEPTTGINDTAPNEIPYSELTKLGADVLVLCQLTNTTETFGNATTCQTITFPAPDPGTDDWANIGTGNPAISIVVPDRLVFQTSLVSNYEGTLFSTQPKLNVLDVGGQKITMLGTTGYEWQITVSIRVGTGHPDAVLSGNTTVTFSNGWANFTDLAISHMGTGYILDFNVTQPSEAENFTLSSSPFNVASRPIKGNAKFVSSDIVKDNMFVIVLELRDEQTNEVLSNISWRGHAWTAKAELIDLSDYGTLSGTKQTTFEEATGEARFSSLEISALGPYYIQFRVESNPAGYNFTFNHKVDIHSAAHLSMTIEKTSELEMRFPVDFNKVLPDDDSKAKFEQKVVQKFVNDYPDIKLTNSALREGSILVTFTVSGSSSSVNSTIYNICDNLTTSYTFSFNGYSLGPSGYLTANGVSYYGSVCGEITSDSTDDDDSLHPGIIAAICIAGIFLLVVIAVIVAWKCKVYPQTKTHDVSKVQYIGSTNEPMENILFRENTFNSIKSGKGVSPAPPAYHNYAMFVDPKDNYMRQRSGRASPLPMKQGLPPVYDGSANLLPPKIMWSDGTTLSVHEDRDSRCSSASTVGIGGGSPDSQAHLIRATSSRERLFTRSPTPNEIVVKKPEAPITVNNVDEN